MLIWFLAFNHHIFSYICSWTSFQTKRGGEKGEVERWSEVDANVYQLEIYDPHEEYELIFFTPSIVANMLIGIRFFRDYPHHSVNIKERRHEKREDMVVKSKDSFL